MNNYMILVDLFLIFFIDRIYTTYLSQRDIAKSHSRSFQGFNDIYDVQNTTCFFDVDCMTSCPDSHLRFCITNRCSCKAPSFSERCDNGNHGLYVIAKRFFDRDMSHVRCMIRTPRSYYFQGSFFEPASDCCRYSIPLTELDTNIYPKLKEKCDNIKCNNTCLKNEETTGECHTVLKRCMCHNMVSNVKTALVFDNFQCTVTCRNKFGPHHIGTAGSEGYCYCKKKIDPPVNACKPHDCHAYCQLDKKTSSGDCVDNLRCVCSGLPNKNCTWTETRNEGRQLCISTCNGGLAHFDRTTNCCVCIGKDDKYVYGLM